MRHEVYSSETGVIFRETLVDASGAKHVINGLLVSVPATARFQTDKYPEELLTPPSPYGIQLWSPEQIVMFMNFFETLSEAQYIRHTDCHEFLWTQSDAYVRRLIIGDNGTVFLDQIIDVPTGDIVREIAFEKLDTPSEMVNPFEIQSNIMFGSGTAKTVLGRSMVIEVRAATDIPFQLWMPKSTNKSAPDAIEYYPQLHPNKRTKGNFDHYAKAFESGGADVTVIGFIEQEAETTRERNAIIVWQGLSTDVIPLLKRSLSAWNQAKRDNIMIKDITRSVWLLEMTNGDRGAIVEIDEWLLLLEFREIQNDDEIRTILESLEIQEEDSSTAIELESNDKESPDMISPLVITSEPSPHEPDCVYPQPPYTVGSDSHSYFIWHNGYPKLGKVCSKVRQTVTDPGGNNTYSQLRYDFEGYMKNLTIENMWWISEVWGTMIYSEFKSWDNGSGNYCSGAFFSQNVYGKFVTERHIPGPSANDFIYIYDICKGWAPSGVTHHRSVWGITNGYYCCRQSDGWRLHSICSFMNPDSVCKKV